MSKYTLNYTNMYEYNPYILTVDFGPYLRLILYITLVKLKEYIIIPKKL